MGKQWKQWLIYLWEAPKSDVNRLTLSGVPFREAYREVGMAVQRGEYTPTRSVEHTHEGSIGNLCNDKIAEKMDKVLVKFGF